MGGNGNPPMSEIKPGLYLGDYGSSFDAANLTRNDVSAIVSVVDVTAPEWDVPANRALVPKDHHLVIPCVDTATQDLLPHLADACDFIDNMRHREPPRKVLVHCMKGVSRSATVVTAYIMRAQRQSRDAALKNVNRARKVNPNRNFLEQLAIWGETDYEVWEDTAKTVPKPLYLKYLSRRAERLIESG